MSVWSFLAENDASVQFKSHDSHEFGSDEHDVLSTSNSSQTSVSSVTISQCLAWDDERDDEVDALASSTSVELVSRSCAASLPDNRQPGRVRRSRSMEHLSKPELITLDLLESHRLQLTQRFGSDHPLVARTWHLIGNAHSRHESWRAALVAYQTAVLCGDVGVHLADAYGNLADIYTVLGRVQHAVDFYTLALETQAVYALRLGRDVRRNGDVAQIQWHLGRALIQLPNHNRSRSALHEACRIFAILGCQHKLALVRADLDRIP